MASHDDIVLIINQLQKSMDKMGDSLSVVKSIGEDVRAIVEEMHLIKDRLQKIEERVSGDHLPTKSEVLSIKETLDTKLTPLDKVNAMDKSLGRIEERISKLRSMDEAPSKSDFLSIKETLDQKLKPLHQIEVIDERVTRLERSMSTISTEAANPPIRFDSTKKGEKVLLTNDGMSAGRTSNPVSSGTEVKENIATCPPCLVNTKAKFPMTFDSVIKGRNVQLSSDLRTATHTRPIEDPYFAPVVSNSILEDDRVFEIRIDKTIDGTWGHGIAIGVIEEKNEGIKDAPYILWNEGIKGTWAIYSNDGSQPGKSDTYKDGKEITYSGYPLSTKHLPVGTLLGVSRRSNGKLHFHLDGVDKGAAFVNVPKDVYAFVDVQYYVTEISITN